jgi:hypothetical protein
VRLTGMAFDTFSLSEWSALFSATAITVSDQACREAQATAAAVSLIVYFGCHQSRGCQHQRPPHQKPSVALLSGPGAGSATGRLGHF